MNKIKTFYNFKNEIDKIKKEMDEMTSKIHWMIRKQVTIPDEFKLRKKIGISKYKVVE